MGSGTWKRGTWICVLAGLVCLVLSCHWILPFDSASQGTDTGPGDDATQSTDGAGGMRTLLDDDLEGSTLSPGWSFQGGEHKVGAGYLELWTPSEAPPYYGTTLGLRTMDVQPQGQGTITVLARFRWKGVTPTAPGGTLTIGLLALPDVALQVFVSQGKLMARFGTVVQEISAGVDYRLLMTISSQVRVKVYRDADSELVMDATAAAPADLTELKQFKVAVATKDIDEEMVTALLYDVFIEQELTP
jgi:hypothetical protein